MRLKKWVCTLAALALTVSLLPAGVQAAPVHHEQITGYHEEYMQMPLAAAVSEGDTGPTLAPGQHEQWIDRINQLPEYATTLYSWLETNAQEGGVLIDPTQLPAYKGSSGLYDTYMHCFHTIKDSVTFYCAEEADTNHAAKDAVLEDLGDAHMVAFSYASAVYGAFDRDHPEVFWLGGRTAYGYNVGIDYSWDKVSHSGTVEYTVDLYFYLKTTGFDIRSDRYQSAEAITADIERQNDAVKEILSQCPDDSDFEKVRYLNRVLTQINAFNSLAVEGIADGIPTEAWRSISALTGNTGTEGPVCEGYSKALMVLCRELGIPCVLAEGKGKYTVSSPFGGHMWNYVKVDGAWYAVDTSWNDPGVYGRETWACTGYENEDFLLVGSNTVIKEMPFSTSHVLENCSTVNSLHYTNGPVLADEAYASASQVTVPTLTLKSPTLEFKDMITVNAMFTAENTEDVVEMGMITYSSKVASWSVRNAEHVIPGTTYDVNTGRYIAHSQGIHAKYLGDTVYMAVYAKLSDGSYAYSSKLAPYSPVQYATGQLKNSSDVKLKQLCAAMLNYGAEAQKFFGHNTGNLANASLTADQKALPESYRADMVNAVPNASAEKQGAFANNKGFSKRYPAISFEGAFCINYFFKPNYTPVGDITLYYWKEADFAAADVLTAENASGSMVLALEDSGEYRGDIVGISAKNLSEAVYVAAVYSDGTTTWTSGVLGYSIGAYCSGQSAKGAEVAALAEATAVYGYHAKAYFG